MRYPPNHKATAKAHLIEAGAAVLKQSGYAATGVDAIAAAAGVTTGAVYSLVGSKSGLLAAAVDHELAKVIQRFEGKSGPALSKALGAYLSPAHVEHPEMGCPIPTLGAEIGRGDDDLRAVFETRLKQLHAALEAGTRSSEDAWALLAQAVGGVLLARAALSADTQTDILNAVSAAAQAHLKD